MARTIALIGGGRWARVHLTVLHTLLAQHDKVHWHTTHNAEENAAFVQSKNFRHTRVIHSPVDIFAAKPTAAIIATRTPTHAEWLEKCLEASIPTFCEKPYALDIPTAQHLITLAEQRKIVAGTNLEFTYASYLQDLAKAIHNTTFQTLEITWHDPAEELRDGEAKTADTSTPHMWDQLPHCCSILNVLLPGTTFKITSITPGNQRVLVSMLSNDHHAVSLSLSRNASQRQRRITLNNNITLNFNPEPGTLAIGTQVTQLEWGPHRPMAASLASFLEQIDSPTPNWPLSLRNTLPALILAEDAQYRLDKHG